MRNVTFAATQFACTWDRARNVATAERLVREAAGQGAHVVLLQELFETPYFCAVQKRAFYELASPVADHPTVEHFRRVAAALGVVIPVSIYERAGEAFFNSVVVVDADGAHRRPLPQEPHPAVPGLRGEVLLLARRYRLPASADARSARIGVAICWDQWFPEAARALALRRRRVPALPDRDRQRAERPVARLDGALAHGHARPRRGEHGAGGRLEPHRARATDGVAMTFYGSSFIAGPTGALAAAADRTDRGRADRDLRPRPLPRRARRLGLRSATAARTCTRRC